MPLSYKVLHVFIIRRRSPLDSMKRIVWIRTSASRIAALGSIPVCMLSLRSDLRTRAGRGKDELTALRLICDSGLDYNNLKSIALVNVAYDER